jgi:hypothetical protein
MSINTDINNLGWFQILAELCRDFCFLNDASHNNSHTCKIVYRTSQGILTKEEGPALLTSL